MNKLSPRVKYGCSKCKSDMEKLERDLANIDIALSAPKTMKQTSLAPKKPKVSSKVISLF